MSEALARDQWKQIAALAARVEAEEDKVKNLEAENKRLKATLEDIARLSHDTEAVRIARTAPDGTAEKA